MTTSTAWRLTAALRTAEIIGRPLGAEAFLDRVAQLTGRTTQLLKRGPKTGQAPARAAITSWFGKLSP